MRTQQISCKYIYPASKEHKKILSVKSDWDLLQGKYLDGLLANIIKYRRSNSKHVQLGQLGYKE
jgi:hypothetical protein